MPNIKSPLLILLWNALIVFAVFMVLDVIFYGLIWPGPNPYQQGLLEKIIYMVVLALAYAHIYNKASLTWRPQSKSAFILLGMVEKSGYTADVKGYKILNGIVFGLLICVVVVFAIALLDVIVSSVFIYVLDAFRGVLPPPDTREAVVLTSQVVVSGVILETHGKTEDDGIPTSPSPLSGG